MKTLRTALLLAAIWALVPGASYADSTNANTNAMPDLVIYVIMGVTVLSIIIVATRVVAALTASHWSLADALQEPQAPPAAGAAPAPGNNSSSRLIAFMGMLVILIMFVSVGLVGIWTFAKTGSVDLSSFQNYFLAGAGLFVPYVFNQLKNIGK